jgi:hypothetical protein
MMVLMASDLEIGCCLHVVSSCHTWEPAVPYIEPVVLSCRPSQNSSGADNASQRHEESGKADHLHCAMDAIPAAKGQL